MPAGSTAEGIGDGRAPAADIESTLLQRVEATRAAIIEDGDTLAFDTAQAALCEFADMLADTKSERLPRVLSEAGLLACVLICLRLHGSSEELVVVGFRLLLQVCEDRDVLQLAAQLEACDVIVNALNALSGVQLQSIMDGIRALVLLCRIRENQDVTVAAGGIACAVRFMQLKASSLSARNIRCHACSLLNQLCSQDAHSRKAFADGVVEVLIAFLQAHASDTQEMEKAFDMISSVTSTKAARLAAVDAGIIRLIVHGQQVHASDQHIQQSAAEALSAICADATCGAKAVQQGAMESVLFHSLRAYPNEVRIQMASMSAIRYMVISCEEGLAKALELKVLATVCGAASKHRRNPIVVELAAELVLVLLDRPLEMDEVSKLGFIKSVHIALAKAPQREELFSAAFRFILRAVSSRSKAAVNSTTSLALVTVETMKNHLGSIEVAALAAKVHLHQLISRDDEVRAAALQCAWQGSIAAAAQVAGALYLTHPSGALAALRACHEYVSKQWDAETREIIEIPDRLIYAPCPLKGVCDLVVKAYGKNEPDPVEQAATAGQKASSKKAKGATKGTGPAAAAPNGTATAAANGAGGGANPDPVAAPIEDDSPFPPEAVAAAEVARSILSIMLADMTPTAPRGAASVVKLQGKAPQSRKTGLAAAPGPGKGSSQPRSGAAAHRDAAAGDAQPGGPTKGPPARRGSSLLLPPISSGQPADPSPEKSPRRTLSSFGRAAAPEPATGGLSPSPGAQLPQNAVSFSPCASASPHGGQQGDVGGASPPPPAQLVRHRSMSLGQAQLSGESMGSVALQQPEGGEASGLSPSPRGPLRPSAAVSRRFSVSDTGLASLGENASRARPSLMGLVPGSPEWEAAQAGTVAAGAAAAAAVVSGGEGDANSPKLPLLRLSQRFLAALGLDGGADANSGSQPQPQQQQQDREETGAGHLPHAPEGRRSLLGLVSFDSLSLAAAPPKARSTFRHSALPDDIREADEDESGGGGGGGGEAPSALAHGLRRELSVPIDMLLGVRSGLPGGPRVRRAEGATGAGGGGSGGAVGGGGDSIGVAEIAGGGTASRVGMQPKLQQLEHQLHQQRVQALQHLHHQQQQQHHEQQQQLLLLQQQHEARHAHHLRGEPEGVEAPETAADDAQGERRCAESLAAAIAGADGAFLSPSQGATPDRADEGSCGSHPSPQRGHSEPLRGDSGSLDGAEGGSSAEGSRPDPSPSAEGNHHPVAPAAGAFAKGNGDARVQIASAPDFVVRTIDDGAQGLPRLPPVFLKTGMGVGGGSKPAVLLVGPGYHPLNGLVRPRMNGQAVDDVPSHMGDHASADHPAAGSAAKPRRALTGRGSPRADFSPPRSGGRSPGSPVRVRPGGAAVSGTSGAQASAASGTQTPPRRLGIRGKSVAAGVGARHHFDGLSGSEPLLSEREGRAPDAAAVLPRSGMDPARARAATDAASKLRVH